MILKNYSHAVLVGGDGVGGSFAILLFGIGGALAPTVGLLEFC
jgi:hypothetical protein